MAVSKYKLKDGSTADYYAWDGDFLHEPTLLTGGIGSIQNAVTSPTTVNLGTNEVANLITYCRACRIAAVSNLSVGIAGNTGAVTNVQSLLDAVTFTTT